MELLKCPICPSGFRAYKTHKYCSRQCFYKSLVGRPLSKEHRQKLKDNHVGNTGRTLSMETKHKISTARRGITFSEETRLRISLTLKRKYKEGLLSSSPPHPKGEDHPNWKGGVKPENQKARNSGEYYAWRREVFERDGFKCTAVNCPDRTNTKLSADHVNKWADYPEFRFDINNGRTLCEPCHAQVTKFQWTL